MEAGSILFDRYGWLRDGQHRLTAVVATGVPIVANVVMGASETAVQATDTGSKRSWSDQLKGRGVHNAIAVQAGVTLSWKWDHDLNGSTRWRPCGGSGRSRPDGPACSSPSSPA